jgi:hypothetical protein
MRIVRFRVDGGEPRVGMIAGATGDQDGTAAIRARECAKQGEGGRR